jgi:hypothetical protein
MTDLNTILQQQCHEKMSLRDQFANTALLALYLDCGFEFRADKCGFPSNDEIAGQAYRIADAMIKARSQE